MRIHIYRIVEKDMDILIRNIKLCLINFYTDNPTTSTELAKPSDLQEDQFLLYFGTKSKVRADRIMVFSDHKITLLGRLENVIENTEGKTTIIGACTLSKDFFNQR